MAIHLPILEFMNNRNLGQKISFYCAMGSYICAVATFIGIFIMKEEYGFEHPITSSFMASVVFFIGVGVVLQVIGSANLPSLKFDVKEKEEK
jgi:hypothetical protein